MHLCFVEVWAVVGSKRRLAPINGWHIPRLPLTSPRMNDSPQSPQCERVPVVALPKATTLPRLKHTLATVVALTGVLACGPSPEAAAPGVLPTLAKAPSTAPTPEPVVVAPEPADVVVVGRVRSWGPMLTKLGEWSGFPLPWEDFLAQRLPRLTPVLRTDLPVDFAVSLDQESKGVPELYGVFSLALSDYDQGLAALRASGEVIASEDAQQVYVEVDSGVECSVTRATPNVRLVCGKHVALTELGPFVATNLSQQQVGNNDLYAELRLAPIYARYGRRAQALKVLVPALLREASLHNARFDAALASAAHSTVDDVLVLARELDRVRIAVDLQEPAEQVLLRADVRFRGSESFMPAALAHAATNAGVAPELFWSLPAESSTASFSTFAKRFPRLSPVVDTLGELGAGALEHVGLASGVADRWLTELKTMLTAGGASAYAHISDPERPAKNLAAAFGVNVLGIEGDAGAAQRFLDASVAVFNDKKVRAEVAKRAEQDLKDVPTIVVKNASPALGLPAGSKAYVVSVPKNLAVELAKSQLTPEFAAKQGAFTLTVLLVKQGERTWAAWGGNEGKVVAALKATLAAPNGAKLDANPVFARWRDAKVNSGGSMRVSSFFEPSLLGNDGIVEPAQTELALRAMPNGGKGFIHVSGSATAEGPQANVQFEVPKDALADLVSAALSLANQ